MTGSERFPYSCPNELIAVYAWWRECSLFYREPNETDLWSKKMSCTSEVGTYSILFSHQPPPCKNNHRPPCKGSLGSQTSPIMCYHTKKAQIFTINILHFFPSQPSTFYQQIKSRAVNMMFNCSAWKEITEKSECQAQSFTILYLSRITAPYLLQNLLTQQLTILRLL